ncbi:MAG: peptidoglycan editing factor PgeF [Ahrensia sp.]|nr:peptidoglycan editing factor PgeF [Ahrensia sp.]
MTKSSNTEIQAVKSDMLSRFETSGIRHGFYTKHGGVSSGIYASLNAGLGSNDARENVLENRVRIATHLGVAPTHLAGCYQIHSARVVTVLKPSQDERPEADGMVTNVRGVALGILTADCGPILFADENSGIIGACHAGWQGALTGVAENTITAMVDLGAHRENIVGVLGPCIAQKNYEVGAEFEARFRSHNPAFAKYFVPALKPNHFQFDLHDFILDKLSACGIQAHKTGQCTYADEANYFSYRRTTHRREPDYGRQMSAIALAPETLP